MRFSTVNTSIGAQPLGRNNLIEVLYRQITQGNTPTEVLIDQSPNRRIVPDSSSGGQIRFKALAYNITDNTTLYAEGFVAFTCSIAGVIALSDQDSGTGGTQDNVLVAVTAVTRAGALGVTVTADNGLQFDVVAATGTLGTTTYTPAFIRCQVRGFTAKAIAWEIYAELLEATATNA